MDSYLCSMHNKQRIVLIQWLFRTVSFYGIEIGLVEEV